MTDTQDGMREEFERDYGNRNKYPRFGRNKNGEYFSKYKQIAWEAWQACAKIKDAEIARLQAELSAMKAALKEFEDAANKGINLVDVGCGSFYQDNSAYNKKGEWFMRIPTKRGE